MNVVWQHPLQPFLEHIVQVEGGVQGSQYFLLSSGDDLQHVSRHLGERNVADQSGRCHGTCTGPGNLVLEEEGSKGLNAGCGAHMVETDESTSREGYVHPISCRSESSNISL